MRVATWNVNNVLKRLDQLLAWLDQRQPDVVALQELKTPTADFPARALQDAGYQSLMVGQRTWNGVALLGRGHEPLPVLTTLPDDPKDKEARYVEAAINGVLVAGLYLPNGNRSLARSSTTSSAGSSGCAPGRPSCGLVASQSCCSADVDKLLAQLNSLVAAGNTVVVV